MKQYLGLMMASRFNPTLPQVLVALDRYADAQKVDDHRILNQRTILAGVSGSVMVAPGDVLKESGRTQSGGTTIEKTRAAPKDLAAEAWWWDSRK